MTILRKSVLTLGIAVLGLVTVLVITVLLIMNSLYYDTNARRLRDTAGTLFSFFGEQRLRGFFESDTPPDDALDFSFNADDPFRLTLIGTDGYVRLESQITERMVNHLNREEVQSALSGKEASARRKSNTAGMHYIYQALPVFAEDGSVAGVFRLSLVIPSFRQRIAPVAVPFLVSTALLVCAIFTVIFFFSKSLSLSLSRLVSLVSGAAPSKSGAVSDTDEFVALEKALYGMTSELNLRIEKARSEGRRLQAILSGMSEAVFAMDENLKLLLVNPPARKLFNLGDGNIEKISLLEATHSTALLDAAQTALSENKPMEMELKLHSGNQEQRFRVDISVLPGGNERIVMVIQNVTRMFRLEQVRKDFVANVSHELRTPIQLMKGFSETLLDSPPEDKEQLRHYMGIIRKNAASMENLVNDLLSLASLEDESSGRSALEEQALAPLVAEAVAMVENQANERKVEIICTCPQELRAKVYGPFIIQALINLLDNAIKYSSKKSRVWVNVFEKDSELVLEVKDEGIGIPLEHQERIFERFYRVDRARSREAGGTGLGLSIVRHIARLHNGTVAVESSASGGSVFRLCIPLL